jgi:hypothetical protein
LNGFPLLSDLISVGFGIYPGQQLGLRRNERRAIVFKFSPASLSLVPAFTTMKPRPPPAVFADLIPKRILLLPITALYDRPESSTEDATLAESSFVELYARGCFVVTTRKDLVGRGMRLYRSSSMTTRTLQLDLCGVSLGEPPKGVGPT